MFSNWVAFLLTAGECVLWFEFCNYLAKRQLVDYTTSRKLIHIGCGLQYLLLWPLFNDTVSARYWCGSVPIIAAARYMLVGAGLLKDDALVTSTSRTGDKTELLKGPVAYGIVHGLAAMLFWRTSPVGIATITVLCAGDGLAEVVGRRLGHTNPLPHNLNKSVAGSLACFAASFIATAAYVKLFSSFFQYFLLSEGPATLAGKLLLVSCVGTTVESFAIADWDNLTVGLATAVTARVLFAA